ncbi:VOC family protein [Clavibacter tessellarius]
MGSLRLDPNAYLQQGLAPVASPADDAAGIGHVHLQVGDTESASAFYVDTLGFGSSPAGTAPRSSSRPAGTTTAWP